MCTAQHYQQLLMTDDQSATQLSSSMCVESKYHFKISSILFLVNCWDISSAVENGVVTFNNADRTYGTIATATCNSGYTISGASTLTCNTGVWDQELPTCTCTQEGGCSGRTLTDRM